MQEGSGEDEPDADFEPYQTLEGHENEVKCVAWSPSGSYVATCSRDKSIWIFEEEEEAARLVLSVGVFVACCSSSCCR